MRGVQLAAAVVIGLCSGPLWGQDPGVIHAGGDSAVLQSSHVQQVGFLSKLKKRRCGCGAILGHRKSHGDHSDLCDSCCPDAMCPAYAEGMVVPPPGVEGEEGVPPEEGVILDEGMAAQPAAPDFGTLAGGFGTARGMESAAPSMLGDFLPGGAFGGTLSFSAVVVSSDNERVFVVTQPYGDGRVAMPFAFRMFKTADVESPWPRDRVYYSFNHFEDVGADTDVMRHMLGFERAILDRQASIGLRVPFFSVDPGVQTSPLFQGGEIGTFGAGTNQQFDIGDLTLIFKYALLADYRYGDAVTLGLAVTPPTGPDTLADVDPLFTVDDVEHDGTIQPFVGFYHSLDPAFDGWFLQGFSAIDVPFDSDDATLWFNDLAAGYIYRRSVRRGLTAIVPTLEAHVNTPLDDRTHGVTATPRLTEMTANPAIGFGGFTSVLGQVEYHNQVNITTGVTFIYNRNHALALGLVTPVSGPQPFDYELQLQYTLLHKPLLGR